MNIVPGLKLVIKHQLTQKEIGVLIPFFEEIKAYTTTELANLLNYNKKTLYGLIQKLILKDMLIRTRLKNKNFLYKLNPNIFLI